MAATDFALPFLGSFKSSDIAPRDRPPLTQAYLAECLNALDIPPTIAPFSQDLLRSSKKRKLDVEADGSQADSKVPKLDAPAAVPPEIVHKPAVRQAKLVEKPFEQSQLTAMNKEAVTRGRVQKHAGDARYRSGHPAEKRQGIIETADALLIYVYAFWCDDHLKGRVVDGVSKPGCVKGNWQSLFGMLNHARNVATEAGRGWEAVVGLTNLLEGLILEHLTHFARRQLHNRIDVSQKAKDSSSSNEGHTPGSNGPSPPSDKSQVNNEETEDQIKTFLRLSSDMEAKARCLNAALFARDAPLSTTLLSKGMPKTYARAMASDTPAAAQVDLRGGLEARFSWPIDTTNGPNALSHAAAFGRALLEEVAEQQDVPHWRGVGIRAPDA